MSITVFLLASSCSTVHTRKAFKYQVLFAHPDFKGHLTHQIPSNDKGWDVKTYDFKDQNFRKAADEVGFWCMIQDKHWFIDPDKPGISRRTKKCVKWKKKIFKDECIEHEVLHHDGYKDFDFLVKSRLICWVKYQN